MPEQKIYPFTLTPLLYDYDALAPYLDAETMHFHHDKHLQTYVNNLNKTLESAPAYHDWPLEKLLSNLDQLPAEIRASVRNNGGGVYNHDFYFATLAPAGQTMPAAIAAAFGGEEQWRAQMKAAALGQFGSGFAWLVQDDAAGELKIITLPNQDTPLAAGLTPLLPLDVWEHAYYLNYQNRRADYIDAWFNVINWEAVQARLQAK